MSKSPHTPEFRAKVSQEYLDGFGSYRYLSAKYRIGCKTLRQWVDKLDGKMDKVEICFVSLTEAHLHDINLDVAKGKSNVLLERCELSNSKISNSNLQNVCIENCNVDGMSINGIKVVDMLRIYNKTVE